jgi:hypothetical protein
MGMRLKHPEHGAAEGAPFIASHIIRVTEKAFDDFAASGTDKAANRKDAGHLREGQKWNRTTAIAAHSSGHGRRRRRAPSSAPCTASRRGSTATMTLVAGALSSTPRQGERVRQEYRPGARSHLHLDTRRWRRPRPRGPDGIEAVAIVTPNHVHFGPAKAFLEAGIHVICDKPLTATLADARALRGIKPKNGAKFLLTHNYTGYPLVRQARETGEVGALGKIRVVQVEYPQDWLTTAGRSRQQAGLVAHRSEALGRRRRDRRHRHACLQPGALRHRPQDRGGRADLTSFVKGRKLDDNVHIMLRFQRRARHAVGQPGGAGQRERPAAARLWRRRPGSNGGRTIRTTCGSPSSASPSSC